MRESEFSRFFESSTVSVEDLAREQGVVPVQSGADMRADVWESDEEVEEFLAAVRAARDADRA